MSVESAKPPAIDDDEFENPADYKPENDAKDNRSLKKQKNQEQAKKSTLKNGPSHIKKRWINRLLLDLIRKHKCKITGTTSTRD